MTFYIQTLKNIIQLTQTQRESVEAESLLSVLSNAIANAGSNGCDRNLQPIVALAGNAHELQISYQSQPQLRLYNISADDKKLSIELGKEYRAHQQLYICDVDHAELATVRDVYLSKTSETVTLTAPLKFHYRNDAVVGALEYQHFYLNKESLMLENATHEKTHLFEGVNSFNFSYDHLNDEVVGVSVNFTIGKDFQKQAWFVYAPINSRLP